MPEPLGQDLYIPDTRHTEVSFRFSFIFSWPFSKLMPVYFLTSWLNSGTTTRIGLEGPVSSLSRPSARRRGHHLTRHHWYRANPLPTLRMKRYVSFSCSIFFLAICITNYHLLLQVVSSFVSASTASLSATNMSSRGKRKRDALGESTCK